MALRYYHEFRDRGNHLHRVEIHSDTVGGGTELITHSTGHPTYIKHGGSRDKPKIIKGKEFQFSFYVFDYDHNKYDDIIESDFKDFYVLYDIDGILQFHGWINPENLSREHFKEAYVFNLSAVDGLAWLKDVSFRNFADDQIIEGNHTFLEFIQFALEWIEIQLPLRIQLNTWETTAMAANQCALNELGAYSQRFLNQGSGNPISCYEVIEAILRPFSCTLKQENGYYLISNKHELNSPAYTFAWGTGSPGLTFLPNKIVDLAGRWYERAELSKIAPKKEIEIIWKNRDIGFGATGVDLKDWESNYVHTFDTLFVGTGEFPGMPGYVAEDEVRLGSGVNFSGDYIELAVPFAVVKESETDYIHISFSHRTYPAGPGIWNDPFIQITIYNGDTEQWIAFPDFIALTLVPDNFSSRIHYAFRVTGDGNYNVRLTFFGRNANSYDAWFYLKDLTINKVRSATDIDAGEAENLILDAWYLQDSEKNVGKLEETTLLGDAVSLAMVGAILGDPTGTPAITEAWNNSYTGASGILLMDIWARNVLNDRYNYKSFMRFGVHDVDNDIYLDSVLSIEGKLYTIISYSKDGKMGIVNCDVEELLTAAQSYEDIQFAFIDEVDGVSTTQSDNDTNENSIAHNFTQGIQGGAGGEFYHLLYAEWSELHLWLDNVILSDAGGIDMDDELLVDYINEHGEAGVQLEAVTFKDATLVTAETNMTFQDGTTGPHTLSDLISGVPSSHAASHQDGGSDEISVAGLSGVLADAQTPASHTHGNITNDGAIGSAANLPIITTTDGVLIVSSFGVGANTFCQGNDSRLSDARTPTAHGHDWGDISSTPTTLSGYGISGTITQFNTALSDGTFAISGGSFHDGFSDFVGNEHINHTSVSIGTASTSGLNGGGTIAATRALVLAVNRLTAVTTLQTTDYFPFYDNSGSGTRRISYANIITALNNDLSFGGSINFGSDNQVPYTNSAGTDFDYSANFTFNGSKLDVTGDVEITSQIGVGGSILGNFAGYFQGPSTVDVWTNTIFVADDRAQAASVGGGITFGGKYTDVGGYTSGGFIRVEKENGTTGQYGFHLLIGNRDHGSDSETQIKLVSGGGVELNYDATKKFETTSAGAKVTGNFFASNDLKVGEDLSTNIRVVFQNSIAGHSLLFLHQQINDNCILIENSHSSDTQYYIHAGDSPTTRFYISTSGRGYIRSFVGFGVSPNTTYGLYVFSNIASGYAARFFNSGSAINRYGIKINAGTSGEAADFIKFYDYNDTYCGRIYSTTSADISLVGSSDERLKTQIRTTEINAAEILSMPIEDFKMISQIGTAKEMFLTGYIAQHVRKYYPDMVLHDDDEDVYMIDKMMLIPVIHRGWQLHETRLETHEKKINRMERHIIQLETKIKQHEVQIKRTG